MTSKNAPDLREQVRALTNREWAFGHWTNPITAALAVYVTGVILHLADVSPWWTAAAGALFTVSFVAATLARHVRPLGIAYSAALSVAVTGWLVWAAGHTTFTVFSWPTTRTALTVVAVGTVPFAVTYAVLIYDRAASIAAAAAQQRFLVGERARWHEACTKAGIRKWFVVSIADNRGGPAVTMRIEPGGSTYREALARVEQLEMGLRATYRGAVRIEPGAHQGEAVIHLNERNMLAETVPMPAVTGPASITDPRTFGVHEDSEPAAVSYAYRSSLTIGQRDGGKTNYQNVKIANFQPCDNVLLWLVDFKQGSVARPWLAPYAAGHVDRPALDWVVTDIAGLEAMLDALDAIGDARAARRTCDKITPTATTPAIRLIVDELADVLSDMRNARIARKLVKALRKHRSEGIDVDLLSQRGTMSFLGPHARDIGSQTSIITVFRLDNPAEVFNTLGLDRTRIGGVDPSRFEHSGTALSIAPGVRRAPVKVFRIETDPIPAIATTCARYRTTLERVDDAAAGPLYARRWQTDQARALLAAAATSIGGTFQPAHATRSTATTAGSEKVAAVIPIHRHTGPTVIDLDSDTSISDQLGIASLSTRDILIREHGPVEGERRYQLAQGAVALQSMRWILADTSDGVLPTRDLIDRLMARNPRRWADLTAKRLAHLLAPYGVQPDQLGRSVPGNPRGYRLPDVDQALQKVTASADSGSA